jgi:glycine cleavage system H protein
MDGFTYNNIFETKGIEYIIIIGFLLAVIPFWLLLNKKTPVAAEIRKRIGVLTDSVLRIPMGIFYSRNHTWAYLEKSGSARIGLDDLLLHLTGNVDVTPVATGGKRVSRGDVLAEITSGERRLKVLSPVSGELLGINPALSGNPGLLNEDPYGRGWIASIRPEAWLSEVSSCYLAAEAVEWSKRELTRFRDFIASASARYSPEAVPVMLQDGGELCDKPLEGMPGEVWNDFEKDFMSLAG